MDEREFIEFEILLDNIIKNSEVDLKKLYSASEFQLCFDASLFDWNNSNFKISDFKTFDKKFNLILNKLNFDVINVIQNSIKKAWLLSKNKNEKLINLFFEKKAENVKNRILNKNKTENKEALDAFLNRKNNGLNLSQRVWKYNNEYKTQIEDALKIGIGNGVSSSKLANYLQDYLRNPSATILEVDEKGIAKIQDLKPQTGVYKNPLDNALRLARTETNIAYRTADYDRWQNLDFIVGYEVHLSNNHSTRIKTKNGYIVRELVDICDELEGKYPKNFKFTGWHPQCRCYVTAITKTDEEMDMDEDLILSNNTPLEEKDSQNYISDVPDNFRKWTLKNKDRLNNSKSLPYFVRDNEKFFKDINFSKEGKNQIIEVNNQNIGNE